MRIEPKLIAILAGIFVCMFLVAYPVIMPEASQAYEQEAYQRYIDSIPSAAPTDVPPVTPVPTAQATQAAATEAPTVNPGTLYALPMDDYSGGFEPLASGYWTGARTTFAGNTVEMEGYTDPSIDIQLYVLREYESDFHIAEVTVCSPSLLRTTTSQAARGADTALVTTMAKSVNALLTISGDYYTHREGAAFVVRQSEVLRVKPSSSMHQLVVDKNGDFHIFAQSDKADGIAALGNNVYQSFCFGPALVIDGELQQIDEGYGFACKDLNPRIALGQLDTLKYVFVAADGRSNGDKGVTTQQLANVMAEIGCKQAYNLDGGGSSMMYWHGNRINEQSTLLEERDLSDCVYFATGYDSSAQ